MVVFRLPLASSSMLPRPRSDATNSATTAAVADNAAATLMPVNKVGIACGNSTLKKVRQRLAPVVRARSMMSGSTERNAVIADTTTGKNDSRKTSSTFGNSPKPNQMMKSGATAIFGTIWKKISSG